MKHIFQKAVILSSLALFSSGLMAEGLMLHSDDLKGQLSINQVFNGFGCTGKNISPELSWEDAPEGTKSFAVTVYDPDAPTGSGWWHWIVFNIDKKTKYISQDACALKKLPSGTIQSRTDFGGYKFGGACPPEGDKAHAYITTVYALDVEDLKLDKEASPALVGYMLNVHTLEKSSLITYYKR